MGQGHASETIADAVLPRLAKRAARPFVLGVAGAQGSGKSTVAGALALDLGARGYRVATLSLDDLYLAPEQRAELAGRIHPLLRTRGVPGTHDVALGIETLERLGGSGPVALPRFDKASDAPFPAGAWPIVQAPVDIVILEGWCLGARPQQPPALARAVNALERDEDPDGVWRGHVNAMLAGPYQALFARIDWLALLAAPGFGTVARWRTEQEHALRARLECAGQPVAGLLGDADILRFVGLFERITRHMLAELPGRADLTLRLDAGRRIVGTERRYDPRPPASPPP